jgi:small subunit ribosomal protein S20
MANLKSSQKQMRQAIKRRKVNLSRQTAIKTAVKKVMDALAKGDAAKAQELFQAAQAQLMRAKSKKLIHRNTAARKISRISSKIARATQKGA